MIVVHILSEDASETQESEDKEKKYGNDDYNGGHFWLNLVVLEKDLDWF